ncbi:hypothetical protein [Polaribacter sp.]|uniref:hypothetical protein n=1 Tax=Polaribacter sp. TaxID=1920175 RepID=UPI003EF6FDE8
MKYLITSLLFSLTFVCKAQSIEKAKIDKNEPKRHHVRFKKVKDSNTGKEINKPETNKKIKAIYVVSYPENGCHYKKPKAVILEGDMTIDELRKLVKNKENGSKHKLNTFNYLNEKNPYGLIYSKECKDGNRKYFFGTYTTLDYTQKKCQEKNKQKGYKCEEIISIN